MSTAGMIAATLTSALVALKITGVIDWSWWLIFLPEILYVAVALTVIAFAELIVKHYLKKHAGELIGELMRNDEP